MMAMGPSTNPPSLVSDQGNASKSPVMDQDEYPVCVPSFSPSITNVKEIRHLLQKKDYYSDTKCAIFEASAKGCQWRRDIDDEGLRATLRDSQISGDTKVHFRAL